MAEAEVASFVLDDFGEANGPFGKENVVVPVVADAGDLAAERVAGAFEFPAGAFLRPELVDRFGRDGEAFSRAEPNRRARGDDPGPAVDLDHKILVRVSVFRGGFSELDENVAAVPTDNILAFRAVEVCGCPLVFGIDQEFLRVSLRVARVIRATVAQGEKDTADIFEIVAAKVSDIPAQHTIADLVVLGSGFGPFSGCPEGVGWESELEMFGDFDCGAQALVDGGTGQWHKNGWLCGEMLRLDG